MESENMKISAFAKEYGLNKTTIRYYTQIKLLLPNIEGTYPDYNALCHQDMKEVLELKSMSFTIEEIVKIKIIRRFYLFQDDEESSELKKMFEDKVIELNANIELKKKQVEKVKDTILNFSDSLKIREIAIPLNAIAYFQCPKCLGSFKISHATIVEEGITNGLMTCQCGVEYIIDDGIVIPHLANINEFSREKQHETSSFLDKLEGSHSSTMHQIGQQVKSLISNWDQDVPIIFCNADVDVLIYDIKDIFHSDGLYFFCSYDYVGLSLLKKKLEKSKIPGKFVFLYVEDQAPLKSDMPYVIDNAGNMYDLSLGKPIGSSLRAFGHLSQEFSQWICIQFYSEKIFKESLNQCFKASYYMDIYNEFALEEKLKLDVLEFKYIDNMIENISNIEDLKIIVKLMTYKEK